MQGLDLIQIPPERGDLLGIVEQRLRQDVALALIGLERFSIQDRAGEQFRVGAATRGHNETLWREFRVFPRPSLPVAIPIA